MSADPTYIQLTWEDPITNELQQPLLTAPIAIGREIEAVPQKLSDESVSRLKLASKQVSRFHALITIANNQLYITDHSANGTFLNGRRISKNTQPFSSKDTLRIGPYKIMATIKADSDLNATELNRDQTGLAHKSSSTDLQEGKLMMGLIGLVVLVIMSFGAWFAVNSLLQHSRPQITPNSATEGSLLDSFGKSGKG